MTAVLVKIEDRQEFLFNAFVQAILSLFRCNAILAAKGFGRTTDGKYIQYFNIRFVVKNESLLNGCSWNFPLHYWCCGADISFSHSHPHTHACRYHSFCDSCFFTLFPPFHVALPVLASPCALVGGKQSTGILSDPRLDQACASAPGSGPGGRWALARPPAGAARRSQWPRDPLCRHSEARLRNLSGRICLFDNVTSDMSILNSLKKKTTEIWFSFQIH